MVRALEQTRDKLLAALRQESNAQPRRPAAKVLPGGSVVAIPGARADPLRRETSALHSEKGIKLLSHEMQREGLLPSVDSAPALHESWKQGDVSVARASSAVGTTRTSALHGNIASILDGTPLPGYEQLRESASEKILPKSQHPLYGISDASGLRVSKGRLAQIRDPHMDQSTGQPIPTTVPSNRSEAIRLTALLESLLAGKQGGWLAQCDAYDKTFAEVVLQVANHCAERGELLHRIRKFHKLCVQMERDSSEMARKAKEEARNAIAELDQERERIAELEEESEVAKGKLDMLRAGMVRLKMLRAIHMRKLQNASRRCKELEWENETLRLQLDDGTTSEDNDNMAGRKARNVLHSKSSSVLAAAEGHSDAAVRRLSTMTTDSDSFRLHALSGTGSMAAQLEVLQRALAKRDEEIAKLKEANEALESQLHQSEQEVGALMAGITQSPSGGNAFGRRSSVQNDGGVTRRNSRESPMRGRRPSPSQNIEPPDAATSGHMDGGATHGRGSLGSGVGGAMDDLYAGAPQDEAGILRMENQKLKTALRFARTALTAKTGARSFDNTSDDADSHRQYGGGVSGTDGTSKDRTRKESNSADSQAGLSQDAQTTCRDAVGDKGAAKSGKRGGTSKEQSAKSGRSSHRSSSKKLLSSDADNGKPDGGAEASGSTTGRSGGAAAVDGVDSSFDNASGSDSEGAGGSSRRAGKKKKATNQVMRETAGEHSDATDEDAHGANSQRARALESGSSNVAGRGGASDVGGSTRALKKGESRGRGQLLGHGIGDGQQPVADEAAPSEADAKPPKKRRTRDKPMIKHLRGAKSIPTWMVFKALGSLMQARVEYEEEMVRRGEEDDHQDIGEFAEDRFVELYGKGKLATDNLRDLIKGIKIGSEKHVRVSIFRSLTSLVPRDDELGVAVSEDCSYFYRVVLRMLVDVMTEDHLSGLKGSAFWTHYSRSDMIKVPIHYLDKVCERLGKSISRKDRRNPYTESMGSKTNENVTFRSMKAVEMTIADFAQSKLREHAQLIVNDDLPAAKVVDIGEFKNKEVKRVDLDCFFEGALANWCKLEDTEEEMLLHAFGSWDMNGDGRLQLDEFSLMVSYANPSASQRKITRAFVAASKDNAGEQIDKDRLAKVLIAFGYELQERPPGYTAPSPPKASLRDAEASINESETAEAASLIQSVGRWKSMNAGMMQVFAMTRLLKSMQPGVRPPTEEEVMAQASIDGEFLE